MSGPDKTFLRFLRNLRMKQLNCWMLCAAFSLQLIRSQQTASWLMSCHFMEVPQRAQRNCWPIAMTLIGGKLVEALTNISITYFRERWCFTEESTLLLLVSLASNNPKRFFLKQPASLKVMKTNLIQSAWISERLTKAAGNPFIHGTMRALRGKWIPPPPDPARWALTASWKKRAVVGMEQGSVKRCTAEKAKRG